MNVAIWKCLRRLGRQRTGTPCQRHPVGHHWRWEFEALSPTRTRVTETFDYRDTGRVKDGLKYYERMSFAKRNAAGIEATLSKLRDRYASSS